MQENLALLDFELDAEQMSSIDMLDQGENGRVGPHPDTMNWMP
jgi:2,5-diketo-D-gluconate reductase A